MEFVAADRHARGNRLINKSTEDFVPAATCQPARNPIISRREWVFSLAETKKGKHGTINNSLDARQFVRPETDSVLYSFNFFLSELSGERIRPFQIVSQTSFESDRSLLSLLLHLAIVVGCEIIFENRVNLNNEIYKVSVKKEKRTMDLIRCQKESE